MPTITSGDYATEFYLPNDMLDVPAGVTIFNAATTGTEVNSANMLTRLLIDWPAIGRVPVTSVRVQAIGRSGSASGEVAVRIRDMTAGRDVCSAQLGGTATNLVAGAWELFSLPTEPTTYAVFVYGDGALDPVLYAATWEWR